MKIKITCTDVEEKPSNNINKNIIITLTEKQYSKLIDDNLKRALKRLKTGNY